MLLVLDVASMGDTGATYFGRTMTEDTNASPSDCFFQGVLAGLRKASEICETRAEQWSFSSFCDMEAGLEHDSEVFENWAIGASGCRKKINREIEHQWFRANFLYVGKDVAEAFERGLETAKLLAISICNSVVESLSPIQSDSDEQRADIRNECASCAAAIAKWMWT